MSRTLQALLKIDGLGGLLLIVAALVFVWLAWSVSLWVLLAFVVHWLLRTFSEHLEHERKLGKRGLARAATEIIAHTASHATFYVGIGVFVVALLQIAFWAGSQAISQTQVRHVEELLSSSHHSLKHALDLRVLATVMLVLLGITFIEPRADLIGKFVRARSVVTNLAFILLGATSFTFFSALELEQRDPEWRKVEQYQARARLANIDEHARDITAAAWVASEANRLDEQKKREYVQFFQSLRTRQFSNQIAQATARELASQAPKVNARIVQTTSIDEAVVPERVERYLRNDSNIHLPVSEEPSLAELRATNERLARYETKLRATRTAAIEFTAETIAHIVPATERELVTTFVEELTSKLSKGALHEIVPRKVADLAAAKEWVKIYVTGSSAVQTGAISHTLAINPASLQAATVGSGPRASEGAVAALLTRLHAEQLRLHAPVTNPFSNLRVPSIPHSVSSSSVRIRVRR